MLKELKRAKVGEFYGTEMTTLDSTYSEAKNERIQEILLEGIVGTVISVLPPDATDPINVVVEDFDFSEKPKRFIFSFYNEETGTDEMVDTLFEKDWKIVQI
jgi:hypothetical protein